MCRPSSFKVTWVTLVVAAFSDSFSDEPQWAQSQKVVFWKQLQSEKQVLMESGTGTSGRNQDSKEPIKVTGSTFKLLPHLSVHLCIQNPNDFRTVLVTLSHETLILIQTLLQECFIGNYFGLIGAKLIWKCVLIIAKNNVEVIYLPWTLEQQNSSNFKLLIRRNNMKKSVF